MSLIMPNLSRSVELFDQTAATHIPPNKGVNVDLLSPVSPPSSPHSKSQHTAPSHSTDPSQRHYLTSHSSSSTALNKFNRLSNISTTSDNFAPYSASLNGSSVSIVDPRSLGYFQSNPVVRKISSSVPNLTINTQPGGLEKSIPTPKEPNQPQPDFDFSSDAPSGSRKVSLGPFKHNTPSNTTVKSVRYTPSHKKSFSIHDTNAPLEPPLTITPSNNSGDAITPPTSPLASTFDTTFRETNKYKFPFKSASLPHLGKSQIPRKTMNTGSMNNSMPSKNDQHQSNIPRLKGKIDQLATSQSNQSHYTEPSKSPNFPPSRSEAPQNSSFRSNGNMHQNINNRNNNNNNDPNSNGFLEPLPNSQPATGYPFLRALHAFDATSLSSDAAHDSEENPASICLTFQESEIVLLHSIHPSGWGDATILSNGVRGWIPTNYFTPYTDVKVTPLLSAVLSFVLNPKSQPLSNGEGSAPTNSNTIPNGEFSFSQSSITGIVAGVRSLLEACGTLTRDTQIVRRSQSIRKFRKILLAELAILVSLAKQYRNTTEDANIERLVTGSYKIISRAVVFLDIWTIDTSNPAPQTDEHKVPHASFHNGASSIDNLHSALSRRDPQSTAYNAPGIETIHEARSGSDTEEGLKVTVNPIPARTNRSANRESVIFHQQPPYAKQRLDEVNDALTSYLGNFIHRMTVLETDPTACTQILVNTRKSMLACRELLAAVESISSRSLPRNKDLETCKDNLFGQIRTLVTAARDVVATTPSGDAMKQAQDDDEPEAKSRPAPSFSEVTASCSPEGQKLIDIATDCARTSGECVVRCRHILEKIGDFQLATNREYPDFSDGIIAVSNGRKRNSLIIPNSVSVVNPSPSSSTFSPYLSNDDSDVVSPVSPLGTFPYGRGSSQTLINSNSKLPHPSAPDAGSQSARNSPKGSDKHSSLLPHIPNLSPLISNRDSNEYTGGTMVSIDTALSAPHSPTSVDGFEEVKQPGQSSRIPALIEEDDDQLREEEEELERLPVPLALEDQVIVDDNGRVRGGSMDGLVKLLTDDNVDQDPTFISTFFLTFRQFSSSMDFAEALVRRYGSELDETVMDSDDIEMLVARRTKVYNVLKRWMESHWKHSVDAVVLPQIVNFANMHIMDIPNAKAVINDLATKVQQVREGEPIVPRFISVPGGNSTRMAAITYSHAPMVGSSVSRHLAGLLIKAVEHNDLHSMDTDVDDDTKSIQSTSNSTWSNSLRMVKGNALASVMGNPVSILDIEASDIAKQLSLIDSHLFCMIKPEELLDLNFSAKRRHLGIAVNVNEMTLNANMLSSFVGDSILGGDVAPKIRRNLLKQWIKISEKCYEMRNFNSLMTIISALQSVNIMRLRKTWEILSPRYVAMFNELKSILSMEKNYASYRAKLRANEIPTIPYLGLYLTDLTFVTEGNSTHRLLAVDENGRVIPPGRKPSGANGGPSSSGHANQRGPNSATTMVINFDRYERTARIIGEVQNFQVAYRVTAGPELQSWLKSEMGKAYSSVSKDHNNLWRRSCIVEPK